MPDQHDPIRIHACFQEIAAEISVPLADALRTVGPVSFPDREDKGLAHFLCRAVVGQQLSTKAASSIWARVESAASLAGHDIPQFFHDDCVDALRACGVSGNKIKALRCLRDAERDGLLHGQTLRRLDHDGRSQRLLAIWGVGQWTCDMASIFYCRAADVWPEGDLAVQKTFGRLIGRRKPAKAALRFAPFRSYLALSMWKIVNAVPKR